MQAEGVKSVKGRDRKRDRDRQRQTAREIGINRGRGKHRQLVCSEMFIMQVTKRITGLAHACFQTRAECEIPVENANRSARKYRLKQHGVYGAFFAPPTRI